MSGALIWYVIRLVLLLLFVVLAFAAAFALPHRRRFAGPVRALGMCVVAVLGAVLAGLSAARPSWLWLTGALVVGAALGAMVGRQAEPSVRGGRPAVRRWAIAPILQSLGVVVLAITVLFGTPSLVALAMIWMALAWAMQAGCEVGEWTVAPKRVVPASAPPVVPAELTPVRPAPPAGAQPPPFPPRSPQA